MRKSIVSVLATLLLLSAVPARASETRSDWAEFGFGVAAIATNILYVPAKVTYALIGGLVGSLALGVTGGNMRAADEIWSPTLSGDYVVTTDMLAGERPLHFVGSSYHTEPRDF